MTETKKIAADRPTVRDAARKRMGLDGPDAQALEGALSQVERELADALALTRELEAIVERLPKTADGVPVDELQSGVFATFGGKVEEGWVQWMDDGGRAPEWAWRAEFCIYGSSGLSVQKLLSDCYSTESAARAGRGE